MNKLYYLLVSSLAIACMTEYPNPEQLSLCFPQHEFKPDFDTVEFQKQYADIPSVCVSESIYFSVEFDQGECKSLTQSHAKIGAYFENRNLFFISTRPLQSVYSLEYTDIDDFYATITEPRSEVARIENHYVLKIPIQSNIVCPHQVKTVLSIQQECVDEMDTNKIRSYQ